MKIIVLEIPDTVKAINIVASAYEKDGSSTFGGRSFATDVKKIVLKHNKVGCFEWEQEGK